MLQYLWLVTLDESHIDDFAHFNAATNWNAKQKFIFIFTSQEDAPWVWMGGYEIWPWGQTKAQSVHSDLTMDHKSERFFFKLRNLKFKQ